MSFFNCFKLNELKVTDISPSQWIALIKDVIDRSAYQSQLQKELGFSQHLDGYSKGYTTQYALLKLIESLKKVWDDVCLSATVLIDLLKALNTINHILLTTKF